jgi:hypothetical protein
MMVMRTAHRLQDSAPHKQFHPETMRTYNYIATFFRVKPFIQEFDLICLIILKINHFAFKKKQLRINFYQKDFDHV